MKGKRKKFGKGSKLEPVITGKRNDRIGGDKLAQHLPAGPTRRAGRVVEIRNCDSDDFVISTPLADGAE